MDAMLIVAVLLAICVIAFIPVVIKAPKDVSELQKENGWLKEVIQNRDDMIEDLQEELARK